MDYQLVDTINIAIAEALANMHTCTIAKITSVNHSTIGCKPVVNRFVNGQSIELPEFKEVPIIIMQGGGSYLHFPVAVGDYVILLFTERCFDGWWNNQDFTAPLEYRMHDYSDGVAICGINNGSGQIAIPSVIQQTGVANYDGDHTHQGNMTRVGNLNITGNINITGGDITIDGIPFKTHRHGGVQTGGGISGVPV
jgi:hypothetical protein